MPPFELVVDLLLQLAVPAALASAVALAVLGGLADRRWRHLSVATAAAVGLIAGNWYRRSVAYLPDDFGWPWLLPVAVTALLVGGISLTMYEEQPKLRLAISTGAILLLVWLLVPVELRTPPWLVGFSLVAAANLLALDLHAKHARSWLISLLWAGILCGGAAAVAIYSHSARLSDGALLFGASLAGVAVVAWRFPVDLRVVAPALGVYLPGLMLASHYSTSDFSEVPWPSFVLVAGAPVPLFFLALPVVRRLSPAAHAATQILLLAIPIALAIALAIRAEGFAVGY